MLHRFCLKTTQKLLDAIIFINTCYSAPVVVYARFESLEAFNTSDGFEVKNAHLRLRCIFKSNQDIIGDLIKIFKVNFTKNLYPVCCIIYDCQYVFHNFLYSKYFDES